MSNMRHVQRWGGNFRDGPHRRERGWRCFNQCSLSIINCVEWRYCLVGCDKPQYLGGYGDGPADASIRGISYACMVNRNVASDDDNQSDFVFFFC
jgi:hypothetical protein